MTDDSRWHLDRKVPIAIIVALLVQAAGFIWWAATQAQIIDELRRELTSHRQRIDMLDSNRNAFAERVVRLEEQTRLIYEIVRRIDARLDRRPE